MAGFDPDDMWLVGLMLVRNEDWILGYSARVALQYVDELIVLDHASDDATPEILDEIEDSTDKLIRMESEDGRQWDEMDLRQSMLDKARELYATHIAIIDADEILTANITDVRQRIARLEKGELLDYPMIPVWRTMDLMRTDPCVWTNARVTLAFRDHDGLQWSARDGYQYHCRPPHGSYRGPESSGKLPATGGGIMHCQWADWDRLVAKQTWYQMVERARWPDREPVHATVAKYSQAMCEDGMMLEKIPDEWTAAYKPLRRFMRHSPAPWHLREIVRMLKHYGPETFAGINFQEILENY